MARRCGATGIEAYEDVAALPARFGVERVPARALAMLVADRL
jgi:hypothetical protein